MGAIEQIKAHLEGYIVLVADASQTSAQHNAQVNLLDELLVAGVVVIAPVAYVRARGTECGPVRHSGLCTVANLFGAHRRTRFEASRGRSRRIAIPSETFSSDETSNSCRKRQTPLNPVVFYSSVPWSPHCLPDIAPTLAPRRTATWSQSACDIGMSPYSILAIQSGFLGWESDEQNRAQVDGSFPGAIPPSWR